MRMILLSIMLPLSIVTLSASSTESLTDDNLNYIDSSFTFEDEIDIVNTSHFDICYSNLNQVTESVELVYSANHDDTTPLSFGGLKS